MKRTPDVLAFGAAENVRLVEAPHASNACRSAERLALGWLDQNPAKGCFAVSFFAIISSAVGRPFIAFAIAAFVAS